jgi:hypothetical protein
MKSLPSSQVSLPQDHAATSMAGVGSPPFQGSERASPAPSKEHQAPASSPFNKPNPRNAAVGGHWPLVTGHWLAFLRVAWSVPLRAACPTYAPGCPTRAQSSLWLVLNLSPPIPQSKPHPNPVRRLLRFPNLTTFHRQEKQQNHTCGCGLCVLTGQPGHEAGSSIAQKHHCFGEPVACSLSEFSIPQHSCLSVFSLLSL